MKPSPKVHVTGIGCLCAAGSDLQTCMQTLFKGGVLPQPPRRFATSHPVAYPVFEIPDELPSGKDTGGFPLMRTAQLALIALRQALDDGEWAPEDLRSHSVGVCIGTTVGSSLNNEAFYREFREGRQPDLEAVRRFLNSNPAQVIASATGVSGPCQTVVNACSSGTDAIGLGKSWIQQGLCDVVIAGGADELCRVTYNGFISLMITDDAPCKPFDRRRKGLNLGEGASMLVLASDALVRKEKRKSYAVVSGYGSACDAYHLTAPEPGGRGLRNAIEAALREGSATAGEVAFVNAHGTGTPDNDRVESAVLHQLLPGVPFYSTKGCTGHALGAAGALEAVFAIGSLRKGSIPASAGFREKDPDLSDHPAERETTINGAFAISQSLAFGGNNSVLLFSKGDV